MSGDAVIIVKADLQGVPPAITVAQALARVWSGRITVLCTGTSPEIVQLLASQGVRVDSFPRPSVGRDLFSRVRMVVSFGMWAGERLKRLDPKLVWIVDTPALLSLQPHLRDYRYVAHCLELSDGSGAYGLLLKHTLPRAAAVVACEPNRAEIMRSWFDLASTPAVLPNRPFVTDQSTHRPIGNPRAQKAIADLAGRIVVLYQGHIGAVRNLVPLADVVGARDSLALVLMGTSHSAELMRRLHRGAPTLTHIDNLPAPSHLEVTSHADVGIVSYGYENLNQVFCAPNKVWEYAAYGVPVLGANLPGVRQLLEPMGAGICADFTDRASIAQSLDLVIKQRHQLGDGAHRLYGSVDPYGIVDDVLSKSMG